MAHLDLAGGLLILHLSLLERLGGFVRGDAQVPLGSVRAARATDDPWRELRGIRMPGTGLPGKIALGTRRFSGGKDFVAVYGKGPAVIVELAGVEFRRLVVSTRDAEAVAAEITTAAAATRS
jgi:hypothetical protein